MSLIGPIFPRWRFGLAHDRCSLVLRRHEARFTSIKKAANRAASGRDLPNVRKEVTAYGLRHAYVTRWIEQDRPVWKLCELLNTSEQMLRQNYSHLFERMDSLREALNDFDQPGTGG